MVYKIFLGSWSTKNVLGSWSKIFSRLMVYKHFSRRMVYSIRVSGRSGRRGPSNDWYGYDSREFHRFFMNWYGYDSTAISWIKWYSFHVHCALISPQFLSRFMASQVLSSFMVPCELSAHLSRISWQFEMHSETHDSQFRSSRQEAACSLLFLPSCT